MTEKTTVKEQNQEVQQGNNHKVNTLSDLAKAANRIMRAHMPMTIAELADLLIEGGHVEDDQQFALDSEELKIWWGEIWDALEELIWERKIGAIYNEETGKPETLFLTVVYPAKEEKTLEKKKFKFGRDVLVFDKEEAKTQENEEEEDDEVQEDQDGRSGEESTSES